MRSGALGIATLISWLITVGIGAYMLSRWIAGGGLRRRSASSDGLPSPVIFGHAGLAGTGLVVWASYLASGWAALAWSALGLLTLVLGLGLATVTVWTPYPGPRVFSESDSLAPTAGARSADAEELLAGKLTDEALARVLGDDLLARKLVDDLLAQVLAGAARAPRKRQRRLVILIPVVHGVAALTTFLLAVLTTVSGRF